VLITFGISLLLSFALSALAQNLSVTVNGNSTTFSDSIKIPFEIPYTLYWQRITPSSTQLTIGVVAQPPDKGGWVGVGFNQQQKMTPSVAIIASKPANTNKDTVLLYNLSDKSTSGVQPSSASVLSASNVQYTSDGTVAFVFTLLLPFSPYVNSQTTALNGMIFAYGGVPSNVNNLPMHDDFATARVALDGGASMSVTSTDSRTFMVYAHAACMVIGWLLIVPLGAFFANINIRTRLFPNNIDSNPRHTYAHKVVMYIMLGFVIVGLLIGLFMIGSRTFIAHLCLGIGIKVLLVVQKILGYWRTTIIPTEKPKTAFAVWKKEHKGLILNAHRYNGRVLWMLAVVNVYIGLTIFTIFGPVADVVVYGVLVGLGAMFLIAGPLYGVYSKQFGGRGGSKSALPVTVPVSSAPPIQGSVGYAPLE